jgi:hypothetical protein
MRGISLCAIKTNTNKDEAMEYENNQRASIARRNQLRALESRDYKLMITMFSIAAYSALSNLMGAAGGALHVKEGAFFVFQFALGLVLSLLYGLAAHEIWFRKYQEDGR